VRQTERRQYLAQASKIAWNVIFKGRYDFTFDWMPLIVSGMSFAQRRNLLKAGLNLAYRRLLAWSWPLNMQIELTSYCNLRCVVCPVGTNELTRGPRAIDIDLFESLLREVGPYLLTLSLWAWGEPLLHPKLDQVLAITRRYPMATLLSTNGQNLNQKRIQEVLRKEPPSQLIVAIDGLCDQSHSLYRKGARLEPALEGVRALSAWKQETGSRLPILHCRFLAMKHNEHELPRLRQFAAENGFDMVSIRSLSIIDSSEEQSHRALLPDAEELRAYAYEDGKRVRRDDFICQHAFSFPSVFADGTVVACDQDYNGSHAYGVYSKERSFASIWFSREAAAIRKTIRDDPGQYSFCGNCPYADRPTSSCSLQGYPLRPIAL
jgi:radical SAM protein with 4Fe4S-binding SPASM domain